MNMIDCDNCKASFVLDDSYMGILKKGDFVVKYISCPACGAKYQAFTTDTEMRKLIEQRKAVQLKIKAAFAKKFREKTIRKYEKELDQIKRQQKKLMPGLNAAGEKILQQKNLLAFAESEDEAMRADFEKRRAFYHDQQAD